MGGYNSHHKNGPLAQLAEQLTLNQLVPGSSPGWVTRRRFIRLDSTVSYLSSSVR